MKTSEKKNEAISALAQELINHKWNCTSRSGNVCKIMKLLGPGWDNVAAMKTFLEAEKKRMDKFDFGNYYGSGIIDSLDKLVAAVEAGRTNKTVFSTEKIVGMQIKTALKESSSYREFNWDNYDSLQAADMLEIMHTFDTYFRGKIHAIHKIYNGKYVIIETKKHPYDYDKQRTKWHEPEETHFYAFDKRKDGKYWDTSNVWHSFEDALFFVVCPDYHSAMSALLNQSRLEEAESQKREEEKKSKK